MNLPTHEAGHDGERGKLRHWRIRVFLATWLSYFGFYFCRRTFYVVKSTLGEEAQWNAETLGFVGAAYLVAYMLGQFSAGGLGHRFGPRRVLLGGMGLSIVANLGFGLTHSLVAFSSLMVINGLAQGSGWANNIGIMGRWFRRSERGTILGFWATNFQVGSIVATNLAAFLFASYGVQWAFFGGALVLQAIWLFFLVNAREGPETVGLAPIEAELEIKLDPATSEKAKSSAVPAGSSTRQVWTNVALIGCFYFFLKLIRYAVWSWVPFMLYRYYGMAKDDAGYLSTLFDIGGFAGVLLAGYLSDRLFSGRRALISCIFVSALFLACIVLYVAGQHDLLLFSACLALIGFSLYGPDALMTGAGAIDVGGAKRAVLAAGLIGGLGSAGPVVQELWLGHLFDQGRVDLVFAVLLGCAGAALVCGGMMLVRNRAGTADL
jgi:sugar phosphate permease